MNNNKLFWYIAALPFVVLSVIFLYQYSSFKLLTDKDFEKVSGKLNDKIFIDDDDASVLQLKLNSYKATFDIPNISSTDKNELGSLLKKNQNIDIYINSADKENIDNGDTLEAHGLIINGNSFYSIDKVMDTYNSSRIPASYIFMSLLPAILFIALSFIEKKGKSKLTSEIAQKSLNFKPSDSSKKQSAFDKYLNPLLFILTVIFAIFKFMTSDSNGDDAPNNAIVFAAVLPFLIAVVLIITKLVKSYSVVSTAKKQFRKIDNQVSGWDLSETNGKYLPVIELEAAVSESGEQKEVTDLLLSNIALKKSNAIALINNYVKNRSIELFLNPGNNELVFINREKSDIQMYSLVLFAIIILLIIL